MGAIYSGPVSGMKEALQKLEKNKPHQLKIIRQWGQRVGDYTMSTEFDEWAKNKDIISVTSHMVGSGNDLLRELHIIYRG